MLERAYFQVHIQIRPVKVGMVEEFDIIDIRDLSVFKPWAVAKRQKELTAFNRKPNA